MRYQHDCQECVFLGEREEYDLYYCNGTGSGRTIIARYGDGEGDYISGIEIAKKYPDSALRIALDFAIDRGLFDKIINGLQVKYFDLSACHFCGSDMIRLMKITYPEGTHEKTDSPTGYQVSCINCSARGPGGSDTSEAAFMAWNKGQKI